MSDSWGNDPLVETWGNDPIVQAKPAAASAASVPAREGPIDEMLSATPRAWEAGVNQAASGFGELINAPKADTTLGVIGEGLKGLGHITLGELGALSSPLAGLFVGPQKLVDQGIGRTVEEVTGSRDARDIVTNTLVGLAGAPLGLERPVSLRGLSTEASARVAPVIERTQNALRDMTKTKDAAKNKPTNEINKLLAEGVDLTPGQMAGRTAKSVEDKLTSVPLVGDAIQHGQRASIESFNKAAINRALAPIGQTLPTDIRAGRDAISHADNALGQAYDTLLPKLKIKADMQMVDDLKEVLSPDTNMAAKQREDLQRIVQNEVLDKFNWQTGGKATGETAKEVESQLRVIAEPLLRSEDYNQRQLGGAIKQVQAVIRGVIERSNPDHAGELKKINEGYANLMRVENAAARSRDGVFSPAQLDNAVKAMDTSKGKRRYAKGEALMQDLSAAGNKVLPSTVSDSGTPGRAMMAALGTLLLTGGGTAVSPLIPMAAIGMMLPYSKPVMSFLSGRMRPGEYGASAFRDMTADLPITSNYLRTGALRSTALATAGGMQPPPTRNGQPDYLRRAITPGGQ